MKRLSFGAAIACALFALALFQNFARADAGHGENCENWREPAHTVIWFRHNGIPEKHVRIVISKVLELPAPVQARVSRIIDEAYKWPRGDMDLGQYIVDLCGKAWISDEEAAEPESQSRAPVTFGFVAVKGQPMSCTNSVDRAFDMVHGVTGFLHSDFRPENYNNEADRLVADRAWLCKDVAEDKFRECFVARCMEQQT